MRCYLDSSAILKLVLDEPQAVDLAATLALFRASDATFITSALSEVEVARALRRAVADGRLSPTDLQAGWETALSGVAVMDLTSDVRNEAKIVGDDRLRSLDAIHLAAAHMAEADIVFTYDERMIQACMDAGVMTARPGLAGVALPPGWEWFGGDDGVSDDWPDDAGLPPGW